MEQLNRVELRGTVGSVYSFLSSTAGFVFAALRVCQRTESREMTWDGESLNINPDSSPALRKGIIVMYWYITKLSVTLIKLYIGRNS